MPFEPDTFVPTTSRIAAAMAVFASRVASSPVSTSPVAATPASAADPYEAAWRLTHCGKPISEAIDELIGTLHVPYDMASSLVWAEMSSPTVRFPD